MGSVKTSINQDLNCTRSLLLPTQLVWPHKATQHTPRMHKLKYVAVIVHKSSVYAIESLDPRSRESVPEFCHWNIKKRKMCSVHAVTFIALEANPI